MQQYCCCAWILRNLYVCTILQHTEIKKTTILLHVVTSCPLDQCCLPMHAGIRTEMFFFWRPLQAKRCNDIELGGQGAGKFLGNECDKLWFTVYRSLPGLDFYTRICCRSSLPSYVHEIVPNYTSRTGNCDCLQVLSLQAVATGYDHEEIATLIKKGTVISSYVCIPAQQAKFH